MTDTAASSSSDQPVEAKKTKEDPTSDSERDPTLPDTRAWVSRDRKKKEIIPPSTYRSGNRVSILVRGVAKGSGTITDQHWSSSRSRWDYEVQASDGTVSWKSEDDLDPA
ncbi:hypothetical protein MMC14_006423 [Varicellaria rhodocarpa]|nr:hypothetical protein [Varicellaria rhodocarpa]